jgi:hypothetical protein
MNLPLTCCLYPPKIMRRAPRVVPTASRQAARVKHKKWSEFMVDKMFQHSEPPVRLCQQLCGYEGERVEAETLSGEVRRFWVRLVIHVRDAGHYELPYRTSLSGQPAQEEYRRVTALTRMGGFVG